MSRLGLRRAAIALSGLLLAGCVGFAPPPSRPASSDVPDAWDLVGRLALANGRDGGSGRLEWSHRPGGDELRFHGALGRGSWRLSSDARRAELRLADGRVFRDADIERLVHDQLGWDIPVRELTAWVTGFPSASSEYATRRNRAGQLELLQQGGWTIRFEGHAEHDGRWVPRKVTADRGEDRVRLIVSEWRFDDESTAAPAN